MSALLKKNLFIIDTNMNGFETGVFVSEHDREFIKKKFVKFIIVVDKK